MELKDRLKELRRERGLTQQEVADRIGVNHVTISGYERGVRRRLLDAFVQDVNVDVDVITICFNTRAAGSVRVPSQEVHYCNIREHSPTILGDVIIVRVERKKAPQR